MLILEDWRNEINMYNGGNKEQVKLQAKRELDSFSSPNNRIEVTIITRTQQLHKAALLTYNQLAR